MTIYAYENKHKLHDKHRKIVSSEQVLQIGVDDVHAYIMYVCCLYHSATYFYQRDSEALQS